MNAAIWGIFLNIPLQAAVHLGHDYEVNSRFAKKHLWKSLEQFFNETKRLIRGSPLRRLAPGAQGPWRCGVAPSMGWEVAELPTPPAQHDLEHLEETHCDHREHSDTWEVSCQDEHTASLLRPCPVFVQCEGFVSIRHSAVNLRRVNMDRAP